MIVVGDTTAITSLLKIRRAEVLQRLFTEILIPDAVAIELVRRHSELPAFIQVRCIHDLAMVNRLLTALDRGEAEAIALAKETQADALLIDEHAGRVVAETMGIRCVGLAGALLLARQMELITSLTAILDELERGANFYLAKNIRSRLVELAGESSPRL